MSGKIKTKALLQLGAISIVIGLVSWLSFQISFLADLEYKVSDIRAATLIENQPIHPDIIIATVTEDTLGNFPYRSPINREFLANLVEILIAKGAKAIALDFLFDQATEPEADAHLRNVISNSPIPIVSSYADDQQLIERQQNFIDAFLSDSKRGYANVVTNPSDGIVRDIFPGRKAPDGAWVPGLPGAIAKELGFVPPTKEKRLVYRGYPEGDDKSIIDSFARYPAHFMHVISEDWIKDKIVFVGAELTEIDLDMKKTPFASLLGTAEGQLPGVMIHAHALAQIMSGETFDVLPKTAEALFCIFIALIGISFAKFDVPTWARVLMAFSTLVVLWATGFLLYDMGGPMIPLIAPSIALFGGAWIGDIYAGRQDRQQKKFIKDAFARYLPPTLVDQLVDDPSMLNLHGERRKLTFIFTDVAGFTTISESLPPTTLGYVLNQYMDGMCQIIFKHGGTIDKFIGDAVMAIFGAPVHQDDQCQRAVNCLLELDAFAEDFMKRAVDDQGNPVKFGLTRMGCHTGEATVGNFGSEMKFDYTALGDTVNASARLESLNKQFGTRIAVSRAVMEATTGVSFRPMASAVVKGKSEPIDIFTPVPADIAQTPLCLEYNRAYDMMSKGDATSLDIFKSLEQQYPEDNLIKLHIKRINAGEVTNIMVLTEK